MARLSLEDDDGFFDNVVDFNEYKETREFAPPGPTSWEYPDLSYIGTGRTTPPRFPVSVLGDFWAGWCVAHAKARSCPVDYVACSLLSATAGLIGNRRWVYASSEWRETSILWVGLIGLPSSGKKPRTGSSHGRGARHRAPGR